MEARNPQFNAHGTIDLEIEHPQYGWIPFTASPDDPEDYGRQIYAEAIAGQFGEITPYVPPPAPPTPEVSVTPWQIREALNQLGMRAAAETYVAGADQRTKDAWEFAQEFKRNNPLLVGAGVALGKTEAEVDALFALAKSLSPA